MDLFCIIIHVVGIDLRRKLLLMKESNLSMKYKQRNKQPSSFPPPEEIHIIDDNETSSRAPAKELHNSANSEKEIGFLWVYCHLIFKSLYWRLKIRFLIDQLVFLFQAQFQTLRWRDGRRYSSKYNPRQFLRYTIFPPFSLTTSTSNRYRWAWSWSWRRWMQNHHWTNSIWPHTWKSQELSCLGRTKYCLFPILRGLDSHKEALSSEAAWTP